LESLVLSSYKTKVEYYKMIRQIESERKKKDDKFIDWILAIDIEPPLRRKRSLKDIFPNPVLYDTEV
jgi:hypothetical protein